MGLSLSHIDDPILRRRILQALNLAEGLKQDLKKCHEADCQIQTAEPKPPICDREVGQIPGTKEGARRIVVRIRSFRHRLLDPDNLCAKSLVDGLRYAGLIPNDRPQDIELTVTQEKCSEAEERTEIELD